METKAGADSKQPKQTSSRSGKHDLTNTDVREDASVSDVTTNFCRRLSMDDGSKTMSITDVGGSGMIVDRGDAEPEGVGSSRASIIVPIFAQNASPSSPPPPPPPRPAEKPREVIVPPTAPFLDRVPKGPKADRIPTGPKADRAGFMVTKGVRVAQPSARIGHRQPSIISGELGTASRQPLTSTALKQLEAEARAEAVVGDRKSTTVVAQSDKKAEEGLEKQLERLYKQVRHRETINGLIANQRKLAIAEQEVKELRKQTVAKGHIVAEGRTAVEERLGAVMEQVGTKERGVKREHEELEPGEVAPEPTETDYYAAEREEMNRLRDAHKSKRRSPEKEVEVVREKSWAERAKQMSRRADA